MRCLLVLCLMSGLVACGSMYEDSNLSSMPRSTGTSAEGFWTGATPTGRTVRGLVLDDGSYWIFYTARGNPNVLAGLVQGIGASHSGSFGSSNTRDFNLEGAGIRAATVDGTYVPKHSFNGTIAYVNGETGRFTSAYDADYELAPNMNLVAGTYFGLRADTQRVSMTLDPTGTVSGSSSDGCPFAGTLSPRANGHAFHVTMTFEGGTCSHGTETITGVAFYDTSTHQLYSVALNKARTDGLIFIGMKLIQELPN
jgi:hypothetical protein